MKDDDEKDGPFDVLIDLAVVVFIIGVIAAAAWPFIEPLLNPIK